MKKNRVIKVSGIYELIVNIKTLSLNLNKLDDGIVVDKKYSKKKFKVLIKTLTIDYPPVLKSILDEIDPGAKFILVYHDKYVEYIKHRNKVDELNDRLLDLLL